MKRIVVAGGGFAGVETARRLKNKVKDQAEVVLLSNSPVLTFTPWLWKACLKKKDIKINLAGMLPNRGIKFSRKIISSIDTGKKTVNTRSGKEKYDFLVLAMGGVTDYTVPGSKDYSIPYRTLDDLENIKKHVHKTIGKKTEKDLTIAVVGGGPSGVEMASLLNDFLDKCCEEHGVRRIDVKLLLLEADPSILTALPQKARSLIAERLARDGIEIRTNSRVNGLKRGKIYTKTEKIDAGTIIWCAGMKPNPLCKNSGLKVDADGGVYVNSSMQTSDAMIYAVGNQAVLKNTKFKRPGDSTVATAVKQAEVAACNIASNIVDCKRKEYAHKDVPVWVGLKRPIKIKGTSVRNGKLEKVLKEKIHFFKLQK